MGVLIVIAVIVLIVVIYNVHAKKEEERRRIEQEKEAAEKKRKAEKEAQFVAETTLQAEQGDAEAQFKLGEWLMNKGKNNEALPWLEKAVAQGRGQSKLNECHEKIAEEKKQAEQRAAEEKKQAEQKKRIDDMIAKFTVLQSDSEEGRMAKFHMGMLDIANGDSGGVFLIKEVADKYPRLAPASYLMGNAYAVGYGVSQDSRQAQYWHMIVVPKSYDTDIPVWVPGTLPFSSSDKEKVLKAAEMALKVIGG